MIDLSIVKFLFQYSDTYKMLIYSQTWTSFEMSVRFEIDLNLTIINFSDLSNTHLRMYIIALILNIFPFSASSWGTWKICISEWQTKSQGFMSLSAIFPLHYLLSESLNHQHEHTCSPAFSCQQICYHANENCIILCAKWDSVFQVKIRLLSTKYLPSNVLWDCQNLKMKFSFG